MMKIAKMIFLIIGCIAVIPLLLITWIPIVAGIVFAKITIHEWENKDFLILVGIIAIALIAEIAWMTYVLVPLGKLLGL